MTNIIFGEIELTQLFKVTDIRRSLLPDRENYSYDTPNRHGSYYGGYRYLPRVIEIDIFMKDRVLGKMRELAWLLDTDNPTQLMFSDEPDKIYYAVVDGATNISDILNYGEGTITFLCHDPFAYSTVNKEFLIDTTQTFLVDNGGTAPVSPIFEIDIADDTGYLALVSPNGTIQVGSPKEIDGIPLEKSETLFSDPMTAVTGWAVNTSGKARTTGAVIQGTLKTVGNPAYGITPNSYGTGAGWHGMTARRNLPASKDTTGTATNFQVNFTFNFGSDDNSSKTSDTKQTGRVEYNIMDESNNFLMGFTMRDSYQGYEFNIPEFWVGTKMVWEDEPKIPAPKKVKQYDKRKKKNVTKLVNPTHVGKWNDFYGTLIMRRSGDTYYFELQKINSTTKKVVARATKTYRDTAQLHSTKKAKTINTWFGAYGTKPPVGKNYLTHVTFRKDNVTNFHDLPNMLTAGDKLIIDCDENTVYLNDVLFMERLDIGSVFFELEEGETEVRLVCSTYGQVATAKAIITEKYL